ncbi:MAG: esterase [Alteromonadaceae bacterium]|nr:esterase [Alteromonadaceae bacterium]
MVFFSKSNAIEQDIEQASDYAEYHEACLAHDALTGAENWKRKEASRDYDYRLIRKRVQRMQSARKLQDVTGLMSVLHEGLHGNLGNIANPALLTHSKTGTKQLIETFISEVVMALDAIYRADESVVDFFHKKQFFEETAHAFGRSCLMLSGGAGLGFFHAGVVKSLNEHNLLPTVISGASAGAIIAAMIGTKNQRELQEALSAEFILSKFRYWRKWSGFGRKSLLDATALENTLIELFDLMTFEEAFSKTGRHINISVSPMDLHQQSRVLNAKTSPNAIITQAVRASTAVPLFFSPVQLRAKNAAGDIIPYIPNRRFVDGSLMADLPFRQLSRLYGVNHSIVSQTNPLAVPFLSSNRAGATTLTGLTFRHVSQLAKSNSIFAFDMLENLTGNKAARLAIHKVRSVIDQQYVGNINILPHKQLRSLSQILANPTSESITSLIRSGEKATWEHIDVIERNTKISETLRLYLTKLKEREARESGH